MGFISERIYRYLGHLPGHGRQFLYLLTVMLFVVMVVQPVAAACRQAIRNGVARFVTDDSSVPIKNLKKPHLAAPIRLAGSKIIKNSFLSFV
jgi:hypothetical protein